MSDENKDSSVVGYIVMSIGFALGRIVTLFIGHGLNHTKVEIASYVVGIACGILALHIYRSPSM